MNYYCDNRTKRLLRDRSPKVYLLGGFGGYLNFGDIIQLKNVIAFHRHHTGYVPIVIMFASAISSKDYLKKVGKWFQGSAMIFVSDTTIDPSFGLRIVDEIAPAGCLHMYGGGYLNRHWGKHSLSIAKAIIRDFKISFYNMSGIQADRSVVPDLRKMFKILEPRVIGLRDHASVDIMKKAFPKLNVQYSFDDSFEMLVAWSKRFSRSRIQGRVKGRVGLADRSIVLHLNTSSYASSNQKSLCRKIDAITAKYTTHRVQVVQAYEDNRDELVDSLKSVMKLGTDFPLSDYSVTNLAIKALELDESIDLFPSLDESLLSADFAVCSSYHVTLFMLILGVPVYLVAQNDFYKQKSAGLGVDNVFENFLTLPRPKDMRPEIEAREKWVKAFEDMFDRASGI